jgi:hypothetical protein
MVATATSNTKGDVSTSARKKTALVHTQRTKLSGSVRRQSANVGTKSGIRESAKAALRGSRRSEQEERGPPLRRRSSRSEFR